MIAVVALLVLAGQDSQRMPLSLRIIGIGFDAKVSIIGSRLTRKNWGSVIVGPKEKLNPELDRILREKQGHGIDSHAASIFPQEPMEWSVTKNRDSSDVKLTIVKAGPPLEMGVSWKVTGGPSVVSTDLSLQTGEEALVTVYTQAQKLMLVIG
jgi:hypothetical protein